MMNRLMWLRYKLLVTLSRLPGALGRWHDVRAVKALRRLRVFPW